MLSRILILIYIILLSTGCGNKFSNPEKREEAKSSDFNKMSPYKVNGKWYYPKKEIVGEKLYGVIGWYGDDYHGKPTINGETFNMFDLTAAHKTLPMNTMLLVKNIDNGKSVTVRVNDRRAFMINRELEISKRAGQELGIIKIEQVEAEITILGYNGMKEMTFEEQNRNIKKLELAKVTEKELVSESAVLTKITPIVKNTFSGSNITENQVDLKNQTSVSLTPNKPTKAVIFLKKDLNESNIIANNFDSDSELEVTENNSTIDISKKIKKIEIEEITDLVIKPQSIEKNIVYQKRYYVQVGSFKLKDGAERFIAENIKVFQDGKLTLIIRDEHQLFRVWVSGFKDETEARNFNNAKEFFFSSFLVYRTEAK